MASDRRQGSRTAAGKGRGSPEATEKRRVARALNAIVARSGGGPMGLDGRTEKRRQRLVRELKDGRRGVALSAIDVLTHVGELLALGETVETLERQGVEPRRTMPSPELRETCERVRYAYDLPEEAFHFLGLTLTEGKTP
jgi:hypothetical protein